MGAALVVAGLTPTVAYAGDDSWDPDRPRTTIYESGRSAEYLLNGPEGLRCDENPFRQGPSSQGAYCGDDDRDRGPTDGDFSSGTGIVNGGGHRIVAKIDGHALAALPSAEAMADRIRSEMRNPRAYSTSGQVSIDEVGNHFRDPKTEVPRSVFSCNGTTIGRIPIAFERRCTARGWQIMRTHIPPAQPPEDSPGRMLSRAMVMLAQMPHPSGEGTLADRVHFYLAPAFVTSMAYGRGAHRTQDRRGLIPVRPAWIGVSEALALGGGVHLQMYHRPEVSVSALAWKRGPEKAVEYLKGRYGLKERRVHLMITQAGQIPPGAGPLCGGLTPIGCQVRLASTDANARYFANGLTFFRPGVTQGRQLLAAYRARS